MKSNSFQSKLNLVLYEAAPCNFLVLVSGGPAALVFSSLSESEPLRTKAKDTTQLMHDTINAQCSADSARAFVQTTLYLTFDLAFL